MEQITVLWENALEMMREIGREVGTRRWPNQRDRQNQSIYFCLSEEGVKVSITMGTKTSPWWKPHFFRNGSFSAVFSSAPPKADWVEWSIEAPLQLETTFTFQPGWRSNVWKKLKYYMYGAKMMENLAHLCSRFSSDFTYVYTLTIGGLIFAALLHFLS